jgi:hypothetical protein
MAEAMTETTVVPVSMGTLTDEDYERLIVAAMLPSGGTEVVPTVEIAVEPEKPAIVAETALVQPPKAKPPRVCKICGHADGNSVGRIRLGRIAQIEQDGLKLFHVEPTCNPCVERMSPEERKEIKKIGYLISVAGAENTQIRARAAAVAYWKSVVAGTAEPLQARRDAQGKVLCGVPDCKLCRDGGLATRFTVIRTAEGRYEVAGIGQKQFMILLEGGALRYIQLFDYYRSAAFEAERRQKKAAGESVPPPKQPEPAPIAATPVVESEKPALASQPVPVKKLSRAEREARRRSRRARLAASLERDKEEARKRGVRYEFGDDSGHHSKKGGKEKRRR